VLARNTVIDGAQGGFAGVLDAGPTDVARLVISTTSHRLSFDDHG
jgi:hypothetical protein